MIPFFCFVLGLFRVCRRSVVSCKMFESISSSADNAGTAAESVIADNGNQHMEAKIRLCHEKSWKRNDRK